MSRHPEVKWAQRTDAVFITVLLPDAKNAKVDLDPSGIFTFSANAGAEQLYELTLELFDKVNVEGSKINYGVRSIFCILEKVEKVWWKKLLRGDGKAPHFVKVDWDKWVDEDEGKGTGDMDLDGMDFSKFGGMGGMGGMDEFEDSDDEEQEDARPSEEHVEKPGDGEEHHEREGGAAEEKK